MAPPTFHLPTIYNITELNSAFPSLAFHSLAFPAPIGADAFNCDEWYAYQGNPTVEDCILAFNQLPDGEPQAFSYWFSNDDPNKLPIEITANTCTLSFETSGELARKKDPLIINPKDIRNLAGWLINNCVAGENHYGGAISKDANNALTWMMDPNVEYWNEQMPYESTTFYSMYVEHYYDPSPGSKDILNAGDQDPNLAGHYFDYMTDIAQQKPDGSAEAIELEKRLDGMQKWISAMDFAGVGHYDWWDARHQVKDTVQNFTVSSPGNFSLIQRPGTDRVASA